MWSILARDRLLRAGSGLKLGQNTLKMVCLSFSRLAGGLLTISSVFINNHTAVWGSWYDPSAGTWGYACCQSTLHISYCAGQAAIEAAKASSAQHLLASASNTGPSSSATIEKVSKPSTDALGNEDSRSRLEQNFSKKRVGEGDVKLDNARLAKAIDEEKKRKMRGEEDDDRFTKKKKGAPESGSHDVTEEELGTFSFSFMPSLYTHRFRQRHIE